MRITRFVTRLIPTFPIRRRGTREEFINHPLPIHLVLGQAQRELLTEHGFDLSLLLRFDYDDLAQKVGSDTLDLEIFVQQGVFDEAPGPVAHNPLTVHLVAVDLEHALRGLESQRAFGRAGLGGQDGLKSGRTVARSGFAAALYENAQG
ncbi:MAG: hypothetical protein ACK5UR_02780 [Armatimonadota bacterium]